MATKMQDFLPKVDMDKLKKILDIQTKYENNLLSLEEAKKIMKDEVKILSAYEIALAEQELKKFSEDECKKERIQDMLLLYLDILDTTKPKLDDNHPISKYYLENEKLKDLLNMCQNIRDIKTLEGIYERIYNFKIHLVRKQNQLYSALEKKGFDRPTTTMWILDDFITDEIKQIRALVKTADIDKIKSFEKVLRDDILDLIAKEETVLYPTSLAMLTEEEFLDMISGDNEIGFFELENLKEEKKQKVFSDDKEDINLSNGSLSKEVLDMILKNLPVDISYVDENDIVKYYNDTEHRVFPRSKNAIGRNVFNCHPPKSVHIVKEIIEKFRNGEKDTAEFWINKEDIFIYIKYIAIRDDNNKFKGILEIMQDVTYIRGLTGNRTLLTWSEEEKIEEKVEEVVGEKIVKVDENTRLKDLLAQYPDLKDFLITISPRFKMLKTPLARIMIPKTTVKIMSERSMVDIDVLIEKLNEFIDKKQGAM